MSEPNYGLESYKEGNQYGRAILDALYKLAGVSFTFNAVLLTAFGFLLKDLAPTTENVSAKAINISAKAMALSPVIVVVIAVLGFVYNCGALRAFVTTWASWRGVHQRLREYEEDAVRHPGTLQLQAVVLPAPASKHGLFWKTVRYFNLYRLTIAFFIVLIVAWPTLGFLFFYL